MEIKEESNYYYHFKNIQSSFTDFVNELYRDNELSNSDRIYLLSGYIVHISSVLEQISELEIKFLENER